jgi:hypothetical protein
LCYGRDPGGDEILPSGRTVPRVCTINPRSEDEEVAAVVERIEALAAGLATALGQEQACLG